MVESHYILDGFDLVNLAQKYSTPLYVYSAKKLQENYKNILKNIPYKYKQLHFAVMANNRKDILKYLLKLGSYVQVNSLKEYFLVRKIGYPNSKISVTTTNISKEEMQMYIKNNVLLNLDSLEEIEKYGKILEEYRLKGEKYKNKIGIRVFAHVKATGKYITNKPYAPKARVGIKKEDFNKVKNLTKKYNLKIVGVHGYLASNILEVEPHIKLAEYLSKCAKNFDYLEYINFGAGFGLPPKINNKKFNWSKYGEYISKIMIDLSTYYGRDINLKIEPGRSLIGDAGVLLLKVTNIKKIESWKEIGVDGGFGVFSRPYIYGWKKGGYHPIIVANKYKQKKEELYTICGNSVLQGDYLAEDRYLPKIKEGDILAILNVGAYGAVMASFFPGYRKPGEIFIVDKKINIISPTEKINLE